MRRMAPVVAFRCWLLAGLGAVLVFCGGCESRESLRRQDETLEFARQVNALRDAPNNGKGPPLERLRAVECSFPKTCHLQEVCTRGYQLQEDSLSAVKRLRERLKDATPEQARAGVRLLESKRKQLDVAVKLMKECVALQGDLERTMR